MRLRIRDLLGGLPLLLGTLACDGFDFGRLFGGEVPPTPQPSATPASSVSEAPVQTRAEKLTVVLAGEIDLSGVPSEGADNPLKPIEVLVDGEVRLAHLSSPLTDAPVWRRGGQRATPASGELLAAVGVDAIAVAGPHAWDARKQGFLDTLDTLEELGLSVAGGGHDSAEAHRPAELLAEGWSVALLSVTASWPYGPLRHHEARAHVADLDDDKLVAAVTKARVDHDLVLVAVHSAEEYVDTVAPKEAERAAKLVEAGADIVVGMGAHVPRRIAWVGERLVAHGLGNLVGGERPGQPWSSRGVVLRVTFAAKGRPVVQACPYLLERGRPELLPAATRAMQERIFERELARLSEGEGGARVGRPARYGCMELSPLAEKPAGDGGG